MSEMSDNVMAQQVSIKHVNLSVIVLHSAFSLLFLGTVLYWLCRSRAQNWEHIRVIRSVKYSSEARTLLTFTVLVVYIFKEAEAILSSKGSSVWNTDVHVANSLALCGTAFCLVVCALSLEVTSVVLHVGMLFYWTCCALLEVFQLVIYFPEIPLPFFENDARLFLSCFLLNLYVILVIFECVLLICKKSACFDVHNTVPIDDLSSVKYVHSYVVFLSKLLLSWLDPLLRTGYKRSLCLEDLGSIPQQESTSVNFDKLMEIRRNDQNKSFVKNRSLSLWRCLWHMSKSMMLLSGLCRFLASLLVCVPPICLDLIVTYCLRETQFFQNESINGTSIADSPRFATHISIKEYFTNGYVASLICFLASLFLFLLTQHNFLISVREGIRCKGAIQAAVYDKCLRLPVTALNEGQIMNHITVDVGHLILFFQFSHYIWSLPFMILIGFLVLYVQLGASALISSMLIVCVVPVQYYLASKLGAAQKLIMEQADERLLKSAELLQNVKLIKLYSWEKLFYGFVDSIRKKELRLMFRAALIRILSITFGDGLPVMACLVAFTLYYRLETEPLQPAKVFSSVALFASFSSHMFVITLVINATSQARVSVARLQEFLQLPELRKLRSSSVGTNSLCSFKQPEHQSTLRTLSGPPRIAEEKHLLKGESILISDSAQKDMSSTMYNQAFINNDKLAVQIVNGCFAWKTEPILFDLNVEVPRGQLTIVVGPIGSGKSSIVMAMLGEMKQLSGSINTSGSVAVVPQSCWILNSTLRENIIFGQPFDEEKYQEVIEAASLEQDLKSFVNDDKTEIGEKGANLSGGQRQRIAIARALYTDADIYYLDDSLSALDANVGSHVFASAIMKLLLQKRQKTVVLVTHHTHLLPHADHLIVMKHGKVAYSGSMKLLLVEDPKLHESLTELLSEKKPRIKSVHANSEGLQSTVNDIFDNYTILTPSMSVTSASSIEVHKDDTLMTLPAREQDEIDEPKELEDFDVGKLIEVEEMSSGSVSIRVYLEYIMAAVWVSVLLTLLLFGLTQSLQMTSDYFLDEMVNVGTKIKATEMLNKTTMVEYYWTEYSHVMKIYIGFAVTCIALIPISSSCHNMSCLMAAKNLHQKTLRSIVAAPIRFFERTPIGRILNRLSADLNVIDERLYDSVQTLLYCTFYVLGGIVMNSVFVPYFIIPIVPLAIFFLVIQRYFIASSRELQRLDCVTRSPIMAHLSQTLGGLTTIRAFRNEKQFQKQNWEKIDANQLPFLFYHTINIWLGVRLDILGACIVLIASLASVTSCLYGHIESGTVGLVIAYAINISSYLNWMMRGVSETEINFNSVERIIEYSNLESEPYDSTNPELFISPEWPAKGEIEIKAISLRYNVNQDPVIRNVSLHIQAGKKIGICGRTGSGKSSLTMSLFRAVHISEGNILLDGIDIMQVPLQTLRSKLSIIPQEPVLFSGTIRFNMDPAGIVEDETIWRFLRIAQLEKLVSNLPERLDTVIKDGGSIFSIGQKQLLCLARALLREAKVLIMDEATASIDIETDRAIQQIIQQACAERTVLIIAHRISTIQNCDGIVVLKNGEVIEEGTPQYLSSKVGGAFAKMIADNKL